MGAVILKNKGPIDAHTGLPVSSPKPIPAAPARQQQQAPAGMPANVAQTNEQRQAPQPAPQQAQRPDYMPFPMPSYPSPLPPAPTLPAPDTPSGQSPAMNALMGPPNDDPGAGWEATGMTALNPNLGRGQGPQRPGLRALAMMGQLY